MELTLENGKVLHHVVSTGGSFGASSLQQEIGLGKATKISKLIVHWQNGTAQTFENISVNQKVEITEGSNNVVNVTEETIPFGTSGHMNHNM